MPGGEEATIELPTGGSFDPASGLITLPADETATLTLDDITIVVSNGTTINTATGVITIGSGSIGAGVVTAGDNTVIRLSGGSTVSGPVAAASGAQGNAAVRASTRRITVGAGGATVIYPDTRPNRNVSAGLVITLNPNGSVSVPPEPSQPTPGGSSGCNAAFGAFVLALALAGAVVLRKR